MRSKLVYVAIFSLSMSALMSGWITVINLGIQPDFLQKWLYAFINAWPAAFISALTLSKPAQLLSNYLIRCSTQAKHRNNHD